MGRSIADVLKEAFAVANLLDTDYDVVIVKRATEKDITNYSVTLHSFQYPSQKLTLEFQVESSGILVDVYSSYNTLFIGKEFKKIFTVCCKYESITFE